MLLSSTDWSTVSAALLLDLSCVAILGSHSRLFLSQDPHSLFYVCHTLPNLELQSKLTVGWASADCYSAALTALGLC